MSLTFDQLRDANLRRLPLFKNCHGQPAHRNADGSDWSPAQWLQATFGELGEFAQVRLQYEAGEIGREEYAVKAAKELADVQIYLSLLCVRALDELCSWQDQYSTELRFIPGGCPVDNSAAQRLMQLISTLGQYANARKKLDRGDYTEAEFETATEELHNNMGFQLRDLQTASRTNDHPGDVVGIVDPVGVDLAEAVVSKFNEVSVRVGCDVFLSEE